MMNLSKCTFILVLGIFFAIPGFSQEGAPGYQGKRLKVSLIGGISPGMLQSPYGKKDEYEEPYDFGTTLQDETIITGVFTANSQIGFSADWALTRLHGIGINYTFQKTAVPNGAYKLSKGDFDSDELGYYNDTKDYINSYGGKLYQDVSAHLITVYYSVYKQLAPTGMNFSFGLGRMFYSVENAPSDRPESGGFTYLMWRYNTDLLITGNLFFTAGLEIGYLLGGASYANPVDYQHHFDSGFNRPQQIDISDEELEGFIKQGLMNQSLFQLKFALSYML